MSVKLTFDQLPNDIIQNTVSYLDDASIEAASCVCKELYRNPSIAMTRNIKLDNAFCNMAGYPSDLQQIFNDCNWTIRNLPKMTANAGIMDLSNISMPVMRFSFNARTPVIIFRLQGIAEGEVSFGYKHSRIRDIDGTFYIYKKERDNNLSSWTYSCDPLISKTWITKHIHVGGPNTINDCCPFNYSVRPFLLKNLLTGQDPFFKIASPAFIALKRITKIIADSNLNRKLS